MTQDTHYSIKFSESCLNLNKKEALHYSTIPSKLHEPFLRSI